MLLVLPDRSIAKYELKILDGINISSEKIRNNVIKAGTKVGI
mgnify:CR=1 FL=1|jgi:hypothetical protein